jgi:hypothetical protein
MDVVFDYLQPGIVNQVSFAGVDFIRDKVRRFNLPGKHSVGAAFSRDICALHSCLPVLSEGSNVNAK